MKTTFLSLYQPASQRRHLKSGFAFLILAFALSLSSFAQVTIPEVDFKAGAYRGTVKIIASADDRGETTTVIKVRGRSTGTSVLKCMGAPSPDASLVGSGGDLPLKLFVIEFNSVFGTFFLNEMTSETSGGGTSLTSLEVKKNTVRAEANSQRTIGDTVVMIRVQVNLTRVGN